MAAANRSLGISFTQASKPATGFQNSSMNGKPILVGMIVDVSNSMRRNWNVDGVRKTPKIVAVKDSLNRQFDEAQATQSTHKRSTQVFCLGMGFKRRMLWNKVDLSYGIETRQGNSESRTDCSVVCDLLALVEMIPSEKAVQNLEKAIKAKWKLNAENLIAQARSIDDLAFRNLEDYLKSAIGDRLSLGVFLRLNQMIAVLVLRIPFLAQVGMVQKIGQSITDRIRAVSERMGVLARAESRGYVDAIVHSSRKLLRRHEAEYRRIVEENIRLFAEEVAAQATRLATLGFGHQDILSLVDESEVKRLATKVYDTLQKKIEANVLFLYPPAKARLKLRTRAAGCSLDWEKLKSLTEKCIQKHTWDILDEYVIATVTEVFKGAFRDAVLKQLPDWIGLASSREVIRTPNQIVKVLPDSIDKDFYSDRFLFGTTPIGQAVQVASLRLMDRSRRRRQKVLVLVSDGEFDTGEHIEAAKLLKQEGVIVISLCLARDRFLTRFKNPKPAEWPAGAQVLFAMASTVSNEEALACGLAHMGYKTPNGTKLFYQINQPGLLDDVFRLIFRRTDTFDCISPSLG